MRVLLLLFGGWLIASDICQAEESLAGSPEDARIVADDIPRFWMAWDRAQGKDEVGRAQAFFEAFHAQAMGTD